MFSRKHLCAVPKALSLTLWSYFPYVDRNFPTILSVPGFPFSKEMKWNEMVRCINWDHSLLWWPALYHFYLHLWTYPPIYFIYLWFPVLWEHTEAGYGEIASLRTIVGFGICKCAFFSYNFIQRFLKNPWHAINQVLGCPGVPCSWSHTWKLRTP